MFNKNYIKIFKSKWDEAFAIIFLMTFFLWSLFVGYEGYIIYQLIIFVTSLLFIASKIRKAYWGNFLLIIFSIMINLEIVSVYLTERFVGYQFYTHLNFRSIAEHSFQFTTHFLILLFLFILTFFLLNIGIKKINKLHLNKNKFFIPLMLWRC